MKAFVLSVLSLCLGSQLALANSHDVQVDQELEALALVQIANSVELQDEIIDRNKGGIAGFFQGIKEQVESVKETLLASYDENGNGKIDAGQEFQNFQEGTKALIMLFADSNQNGKIDFEDTIALSKFAFNALLERLCPGVITQAEKAGFWLKLNPVLNELYKHCTKAE